MQRENRTPAFSLFFTWIPAWKAWKLTFPDSLYFAWRNASYSTLGKGIAGTRVIELVEIQRGGRKTTSGMKRGVKYCRDFKLRDFDVALRKAMSYCVAIPANKYFAHKVWILLHKFVKIWYDKLKWEFKLNLKRSWILYRLTFITLSDRYKKLYISLLSGEYIYDKVCVNILCIKKE